MISRADFLHPSLLKPQRHPMPNIPRENGEWIEELEEFEVEKTENGLDGLKT
jgi:hypothetical protein